MHLATIGILERILNTLLASQERLLMEVKEILFFIFQKMIGKEVPKVVNSEIRKRDYQTKDNEKVSDMLLEYLLSLVRKKDFINFFF